MLIAGTVTNVCCESTARDAMMRNFRAIMVTDANAAFTDEEHNAALTSFYLVFGDIMSTDMLIGLLAHNAARRGTRRNERYAFAAALLYQSTIALPVANHTASCFLM